jgi:predicted DNA-binding WGR domain protein
MAISNCMAMVESGECWQFIRFERETRYYELRLQQDLFGWVVVKTWGRKSSRLGQMRTTPCSGFLEASRLWDAGVRARERRGYVPTTEKR